MSNNDICDITHLRDRLSDHIYTWLFCVHTFCLQKIRAYLLSNTIEKLQRYWMIKKLIVIRTTSLVNVLSILFRALS